MNENINNSITAKNKTVYSRNEKILRFICVLGITLCAIIGILLFFLNKIGLGILVLCSCAVSVFLITNFFIGIIKKCFGSHSKKRIIYAGVYALIILIPMLTTSIATYNLSLPIDEMETQSIELVKKEYANKGNVKVCETTLLEKYESGSFFYFCFETKLEITSADGSILRDYPEAYVKVNKYTGSVSFITYVEYQRGKM